MIFKLCEQGKYCLLQLDETVGNHKSYCINGKITWLSHGCLLLLQITKTQESELGMVCGSSLHLNSQGPKILGKDPNSKESKINWIRTKVKEKLSTKVNTMNVSKDVRLLIVLYAILQSIFPSVKLNYWVPFYPNAFPGGICRSLNQGRALVTWKPQQLVYLILFQPLWLGGRVSPGHFPILFGYCHFFIPWIDF